VEDDFERSPGPIAKEMLAGVNVPWNLAACIAIGLWLMFTRITLGNDPALANWDHLIGALVITVSVCALAEVARSVRFLIIPLAAVLLVTPFVYDASLTATAASLISAMLLIALSIRRGSVTGKYGKWNEKII
jgi:hypothetical protein